MSLNNSLFTTAYALRGLLSPFTEIERGQILEIAGYKPSAAAADSADLPPNRDRVEAAFRVLGIATSGEVLRCVRRDGPVSSDSSVYSMVNYLRRTGRISQVGDSYPPRYRLSRPA